MTGATSGIGKEVALDLASKGEKVLVLARRSAKAEDLVSACDRRLPNCPGSIEVIPGDLSSLRSVEEACDIVLKSQDRLDMLIHNAGIMNFKFVESSDGIEETLQVNLLSMVFMINKLKPLLLKSNDPRILCTASGLHQGTINFSDPEFRQGYSALAAYRQSKLGMILTCRYLAKELEQENITICSTHPGVVRTSLARTAPGWAKLVFWMMGKSPAAGAKTLLHTCHTPTDQLVSGEYYANSVVKKITPESYGMEAAAKLWKLCNALLEDKLPQRIPAQQLEKTI